MNKMIVEASNPSDLFKASALLQALNLKITFLFDEETEETEQAVDPSDTPSERLSSEPFSKDDSLDKMWEDGLTLEERKQEMGNYIDSLDWSRKA